MFLDQFIRTLPSTQRQKLLEMLELKQQEGFIKSEYEFKAELDRLLKQIDGYNGTPTFKARHQSGMIASDDYNNNLEEIAFDLAALFAASGQIDSLLQDNQQLMRSTLADLRRKIYTLDSQVERYKIIVKNTTGMVEGLHEQMRAPQYTETQKDVLSFLRKERFGKSLGDNEQAEIVGGALQLSSYETVDQLKTSYGRKLATAKVLNRTGSAATNPKHPIDYAIDGSAQSFWAENVLADEPITQDISNLWTHDYANYPTDGAMIEIEIALNGVTTVSEIVLDPYAAYPMEIVSIHGYESADHDAKRYVLASPDHENPNQRSKKSVSPITFQFESVDISKIRILIRQENYVRENYIVSVDQLNQMELWSKISASDLTPLSMDSIRDKKEPGETMAEFDRKNQLTGWSTYLTALTTWAKNQGDKANSVVQSAKAAMDIIKTGNYQNPLQLSLRSIAAAGEEKVQDTGELSKEWKSVSKLSYLYGLYNVSVTGRKYNQRSIYITKPLPISGNVKAISLTTNERHHDILIDTGEKVRITDVEYYLTYKKNPDMDSWKPILPVNKVFVEGEILLGANPDGTSYPELQNTIQFSFRFPFISSQTVVLRRNGVVVARDYYALSDDGKRLGIYQPYYSAASIYTVDYKPVDSAYVIGIEDLDIKPVQFINQRGETGESFAEINDDNTLTLSHSPYVYRKQLFGYDAETGRYIQDSNQLQAEDLFYPIVVRVKGVEYKNITDYANNTYDAVRLQAENEGKCFAQIGNKIYLPINAFQNELKQITIDYHYLTTDIRLKAVLRRNSAGYESVTPQVFDFTMKCQTYDQEVRHDY